MRVRVRASVRRRRRRETAKDAKGSERISVDGVTALRCALVCKARRTRWTFLLRLLRTSAPSAYGGPLPFAWLLHCRHGTPRTAGIGGRAGPEHRRAEGQPVRAGG